MKIKNFVDKTTSFLLKRLSELIGIGQGVNASALAGLGTAAQNEVARRGAYRNARSQYRSALIGGGTAVLAAFGI